MDNAWERENREILSSFNDFLSVVGAESNYFVLGSVALLSYTAGVGYLRKIKDVDVIASPETAKMSRERLLLFGYKQSTFIDKEIPFHQWLVNSTGEKYLRFEKGEAAIEIHVSDFLSDRGNLKINLYRNIYVSLPADSVVETALAERKFKALSPEALYCSYQWGLKTLGRFMKIKSRQKEKDLAELKKTLDPKKLERIAENSYFYLGRFRIKIPRFLLN